VLVKALSESKQPDKVKDNELFAQPKIMTIRAHLNYVNFHIFRHTVLTKAIKDPVIKKHLDLLVRILALDTLTKDGAPSFDSGFWGKGALRNMIRALDISLV